MHALTEMGLWALFFLGIALSGVCLCGCIEQDHWDRWQ
jgi:hypothetical protein